MNKSIKDLKKNNYSTPPRNPNLLSATYSPNRNNNNKNDLTVTNINKTNKLAVNDNYNETKIEYDTLFIKNKDIPVFYPIERNKLILEEEIKIIDQNFKDKLFKNENDIFELTNKIFKLPICFSSFIIKKHGTKGEILSNKFKTIWVDKYSKLTKEERAFELIKKNNLNYLEFDDLEKLCFNFLDKFKDLEFLKDHEFFFILYNQFILLRYYFENDIKNFKKISYREFYQSNILNIFLEKENCFNIYEEQGIFNYNDFAICYDIYNKNKNEDEDLMTKEELVNYLTKIYTPFTIKTILGKHNISFFSKNINFLNFLDFSYMLLVEESKIQTHSFRFWFNIIDLLDDNYITLYEIESFYNDHLAILKNNEDYEYQELKDIMIQLIDLKNIKNYHNSNIKEIKFNFNDFKNNKYFAINLIEVLTNINKINVYNRNQCKDNLEYYNYQWENFILFIEESNNDDLNYSNNNYDSDELDNEFDNDLNN